MLNKSDKLNKSKNQEIENLKAAIRKKDEKLFGKRESSYKKIVTLKPTDIEKELMLLKEPLKEESEFRQGVEPLKKESEGEGMSA